MQALTKRVFIRIKTLLGVIVWLLSVHVSPIFALAGGDCFQNITDLGYTRVETPGVPTANCKLEKAYDPVSGKQVTYKVFSIIVQQVAQDFCGKSDCPKGVDAWGYRDELGVSDGGTPGPTFELLEGDHVKISVRNDLPGMRGHETPTTIHWHGLEIPFEMDGSHNYKEGRIANGQTRDYIFQVNQNGTFMYHSGTSTTIQVGMGLTGLFIVHPKDKALNPPVEKDYAFMLQTWTINPNGRTIDNISMAPHWFTMNGKTGDDIPKMAVTASSQVRIRIANLSSLAHPIHLHGHTFKVVETGAGRNPPSTFVNANTIEVSGGETRTIEFTASKYPGDWLFHCHFLHHIMDNMNRPPVFGAVSKHDSHVGGMHTILRVTKS